MENPLPSNDQQNQAVVVPDLAPKPWFYQEPADVYTHIVRDVNARYVCQMPQDTAGRAEANARLIVRAVNAHDALVAAATRVLHCGVHWGDHEECLAELEAALKLARG